MITLHDFYCICPTINLLYKMEKYCMNIEPAKKIVLAVYIIRDANS